MNLKINKIISAMGIFLLCFLFHSLYNLIPCSLTLIFFPINESIFEHLKLMFTSVVMWGIIEYLILEKFKVKYNNFFTSLFTSALTIIPVFLIIYLPFYYKIGPKMFLNIGVMGLAIIISQIISYFILKSKDFDKLNILSFILIIVSYIVFAYLAYKPIKNELFFDTKDEKYGLNNYNI